MHVEVCTTASAAWAVRCHLTTATRGREAGSWGGPGRLVPTGPGAASYAAGICGSAVIHQDRWP